MAKNDLELQAVVDPRSRSEQYLNHMCGRAQNLGALPKPLSRVEEYLEYLCYNPPQGGGGGGGQPFNGVTSVTYNQQNKQLTVTYSNLPAQTLDLSNLIDVTDVRFDNNTNKIIVDKNGNLSEIDLNKFNTSINGESPINGDINLELTIIGDDLVLNANGQAIDQVALNDFIKRNELTQTGGQTNANKIPQLNAGGKVDISMIPDLSINKIHSATDNQDAENLLNSGTVKIGDTIIVKDTGSVYLYVNDQGANFNDKTIEIAFANGAVKMVNGQIPNPQGNVTVKAEHIEYVDAQIGLGGTTVQEAIQKINEKFVSNIEFEDTTRTLKKTINGVQADVVSGLVRVWRDLDYVQQYPYINVLDLAKRQQGKQYGNNGQVVTSSDNWYIVEVDVEENTEYTLMKMHNYNNGYKVVFFNTDGSYHSEDNNGAPASNGWHRKTVRTPQGVTKVGLQLQYGITQVPRANETMFLRGNVTENINPFIPYADGNLIQVLKDISLEFDNSNSNLKSTTVESAIKEINGKIANAGGGTVNTVNNQPSVNGNVTVNAEHISYNNANTGLNHHNVQDILDYLEEDKASLYKDNIFIGNNTFEEIFLTSKNPYVGDNLTYVSVAGGNKKTGRRDFTSHSNGNSGYVKSLLIRVSNGLGLNTNTNASVWEVEKGTTVQDDRVVGKIVDNREFSLLEKDGVKYIEIIIDKEYANETYFVYQINPSTHMAYANILPSENIIYFDKAGDFTEQDIVNNINQPTVGIYWLVGDDINLRKKLEADFVSSWRDLEYAEEYQYVNLLDYSNRIKGKVFNENTGSLDTNTSWDSVYIDVEPNTEYSLLKRIGSDSQRILFFQEDGSFISKHDSGFNSGGVWYRKQFTTPQNCKKIGLSITTTMGTSEERSETMIVKGNLTPYTGLAIPYTDGNKIQIGKEVSLEFNNSNSNIKSTTVESAIKEVNDKIANVGGGTVTSINGVQPNGGEVILTSVVTHPNNNILLQVGNQNFATLECMTDQDATTIINGFTI